MPPNLAPIAKRAHKKSRRGCQQCKQRKVKCDERRPLCANCEKHFHNLEKCNFSAVEAPYTLATLSKEPVRVTRIRPIASAANGVERRRQSAISRLTLLPGHGIDPFKSYPYSDVPDTQLFMHHYFSNFATKEFPFVLGNNTQRFLQSWWSIACEDPVLFHATLRLSAFDLESLQGEGQSLKSTLMLNKECIGLLRQRVEDPVLGVSDQTIGSVVFLAIVEFERDNMRMVRMHIDGLKRMVTIRGGLAALRSQNADLANLVFGVSMVVMTEPVFRPDTPEPLEPFPEWDSDPRLFSFESLGVAKAHAKLLRNLKFITTQTSISWPSCPDSPTCTDVLIRLANLAVPSKEGLLVASVSECCRIAAVLLCVMPYNAYPSHDLLINVQLHKPKASLETLLLLVPPDHALRPWLCSVGGTLSPLLLRKWFVGHLVTTVSELNIKSWEEMKSHLVKAIWVEPICEGPFRECGRKSQPNELPLSLWNFGKKLVVV